MTKFREDLRVGVLGGVAGLFSVSLFLLVARIDSYYSYLNWLEVNNYAHYEGHVEDLWWVGLMLGQVSLSVISALVVHRYLGRDGVSPFLLWQVVSFGSLFGWGLSIVIVVSMDCLMRGNIESVMNALKPVSFGLAKYVAAVIAGHVIYGSLVQAAVRQYEDRPQVVSDHS